VTRHRSISERDRTSPRAAGSGTLLTMSIVGAYAEVESAAFTWVQGEDALVRDSSAPGWGLAFCGTCGTTLCGTHGDLVHGVTLGGVDGDPGVEIAMHIFVGSRAPWDHIGGDAPQFDAAPD